MKSIIVFICLLVAGGNAFAAPHYPCPSSEEMGKFIAVSYTYSPGYYITDPSYYVEGYIAQKLIWKVWLAGIKANSGEEALSKATAAVKAATPRYLSSLDSIYPEENSSGKVNIVNGQGCDYDYDDLTIFAFTIN